MKNLGPFSRLLTVRELIHLNPDFNPLEALQLLTPKQSAELLLVVTLPAHPDKDVVINMIFDYLTESPNEMKFTEFLSHLVMFVQQGNLSCSSYKTLFNRLDLAMATASPDVVSSIMNSMMALSQHIPPGCIIYSGQCTVTATNQTDICVGVNSTMLQLHLDSGRMNGSFCHFAVEEFACASLSSLKAMDLAAMLACDRSSNSSSSKPTWKLLLSKASRVLDEALDLLSNKTLDPKNPVLSMVLDAIREIRLDQLSVDSLNDPAVIQLWFNHRLRPFLPAVSPDFLSCLTTKGLNCSTYQHILQILGSLEPHMTLQRQMLVYTHFIQVFLTRNNTADVSCSLNINNSGEWLQKNLGGFLALASFQDLQTLYPKFSAMEALPQLTVRQLAEVSATPGQLTAPAQVTMVTKHIPNQHLPAFFDEYSPAILGHENMFLPAVRSAMLQVVFDRANLSDHSVGDSVVLLWLHNRLSPLLVNLSPSHVAPFFNILAGRNCSTKQQGVEGLNSTISSFSEVTQQEIYNHIIQTLRGPIPLQCYGDNYNQSFYSFLERSFMGFQFPNLTTFLSLMPVNRMHQLVNSMPPSALGDFLRRPDVVDNNAELCVIYDNYMQTPLFLETESLPAVVRRPTLPCVWPTALSSSKRSEVNAWFDRRLQNYLAFLTKSLISPNSTNTTSCLAFQKLVSVLGEYNYTDADFTLQDVFNTIKAYLTSVPTLPRCYNDKDPELNSTAWFAEYIGPFMPFLTLEEFQSLGSAQDIQVFTVNPLNIALLNHSALPPNLTNYYTELVYLQDSNFNPLFLPLLCRCVVPGPAFSQLTSEESIIVLHNLTTLCTDLDPQISAALAGNLGDGIDATAISALGNESIGMSTGQITMIKPQDLLFSLSTLSSVVGWNAGQAKTIVLSLMSSGLFQVNSALSLFQLGSLVVGIPSTTFNSISGSQLISASKDPSFLGHLMTAPQIVQQTFVTQIISMNSSSEMIIENVPDDLATEIPRVLLAGFSKTFSVINRLNKKKWKRQQAELFFDVIAVDTATETLGSPNNLSSSVLQGFTCTGVRTIKKVQIKKLIKACRRTGRNKVKLVETQLTCMYNYIKVDSEATSFNLYPPDMLLYYDYSLVPQASCRSYFEQLTDADFSVFSFALSYKLSALFANARSCLGITSTSLTEDNISVLGNMCCTLDASYIENSDPSILEKLKNCPSLTINQVAAVETLLLSGKTPYGTPSTWNEQTLRDLGTLPLYLSSTFYDNFDKKTKRRFLRYFMRVLRRTGVSKEMRKRMRREIRKSIRNKSKRSIENECTVGMISQVTISDETFPFDYDDITQFNCCLSATTVKDNLDAITGKVDDEEYLTIVLSKLKEAYSASSTIPESQVQVLGPASRVATIDDINTWAITEIDTLSSLMDSSNGEWDPSLAKAIISKYLSKEGNKLGSAELNVIGGTNLCSLDVNVLKNISQESLKNADALTLSNCTTEQKKELFTIAVQAFATSTRSQTVPATTYQLIQPYLGGARLAYVQNLAASNISMDMPAFTSLNESVVLNLSVTEVQGLLGTNLADLKSYENQTLVQSWIRSQRQSELETLGVGLVGGRADPTTTNPPATTTSSSTTTAGSGSSSSTTASGSSTTTGNSGGRIRADAGFSFLALLALLVASQHILV
uniref:Mesothelin-like protein n=1 Tax=Dicentrarchus labrax TaxID=13489 RepID=A0A8C4IBT8_DICLA